MRELREDEGDEMRGDEGEERLGVAGRGEERRGEERKGKKEGEREHGCHFHYLMMPPARCTMQRGPALLCTCRQVGSVFNEKINDLPTIEKLHL